MTPNAPLLSWLRLEDKEALESRDPIVVPYVATHESVGEGEDDVRDGIG